RALAQVDLDSSAVNIHVLGDDGDNLVLELFHDRRRNICPVVDQYELQPLLGRLRAAVVIPAKQAIEEICHLSLRSGRSAPPAFGRSPCYLPAARRAPLPPSASGQCRGKPGRRGYAHPWRLGCRGW